MSNQTTSTRATSISTAIVSESTITQIIIGITFALILVEFWRIFLEALIFKKFGINRNSAYQTLIVAVVLTFILLLFINFVQAPANDLIVGIDATGSTLTKTQELLVGTSAVVPPSTRCDCRDCTTQGDNLNPVTGFKPNPVTGFKPNPVTNDSTCKHCKHCKHCKNNN